MGATLTNALGKIELADGVIASIAGSTATECYGVVGMASLSAADGIADLLKRESMGKGVRVLVQNSILTIDMGVIIEYGVSIATVASNVIDNVKFNVELLTGMQVDKVNVTVKGIRV
ncbi:MAG: Asp23/Gls24 family envelope stress response protein [Bacillota bacterium]